jgi:hypothetical protein
VPAWLILLAVASACERARPRADTAPAPPAAPPSAVPVREVPPDPSIARAAGYLVWSVGDPEEWATASAADGETVWMDAAGKVLARRRGVFAASGERLWRWREAFVATRGLNCECYRAKSKADPSGASCILPARVRTVEVAEVGGRGVVVLHSAPSLEQLRGEEPPTQSALPHVGAGRYLFVEAYDEGDACGAHGWDGIDRVVVDLQRGTVIKTDSVPLTAADSARARDGLDITPEMGERMDPRFADQEARWTPADTLEMLDRLSTFAPLGLADDGSNTHSVLLPHPRPRDWIAPWTHAPEPVRRYWVAAPRGECAGWSAVDSAHAAALWARFRP